MVSRRALIAEQTAPLQAAGIGDARRELLRLLSHILGQPLSRVLANLDEPIESDFADRFRLLARRRADREPLAYLTGQADFSGLELTVGPGVLVPRPDSEILVEAAVKAVLDGTLARTHGKQLDILDTCTGSGAIGIAIAEWLHRNRVELSLTLIDLSETALDYARVNAARWCPGVPVSIELGDFFPTAAREFDLITANPPYIADTVLPGLMPEVSRHEPALALAGGSDGLDAYRRLLARAGCFLKPGGLLLLEHGFDQADAVGNLVRETGEYGDPTLLIDFGGNPRVTICMRSA